MKSSPGLPIRITRSRVNKGLQRIQSNTNYSSANYISSLNPHSGKINSRRNSNSDNQFASPEGKIRLTLHHIAKPERVQPSLRTLLEQHNGDFSPRRGLSRELPSRKQSKGREAEFVKTEPSSPIKNYRYDAGYQAINKRLIKEISLGNAAISRQQYKRLVASQNLRAKSVQKTCNSHIWS